jgi:hypothetical protein
MMAECSSGTQWWHSLEASKQARALSDHEWDLKRVLGTRKKTRRLLALALSLRPELLAKRDNLRSRNVKFPVRFQAQTWVFLIKCN